jgi:N-acetylglucosamine-6-sulfatase
VLADDLSLDLVKQAFMPHVLDMQRRGATFTRYFVTDSLCCPSRASIFTGLLPHDSGIFTNVPPDGGYDAFVARGLESKTFAVALQRAGYRTAMLGKYLNHYGQPQMTTTRAPGWTEWDVGGEGYAQFDYDLNENGTVVHYGAAGHPCQPTDDPNYMVNVLADRAGAFIDASAQSGKPFAVEVATFTPHEPYVPAPRNACDFPDLKAPRDPSFDAPNTGAPAWLARRKPLAARNLAKIDDVFRRRAQAVEGIDALLVSLERRLAADGVASNTYVIFSSDNGLHLGQHRLLPGKMTAFDTDIRVPLVVVGPGVPAGKRVAALSENIDLYPTFLGIAGLTARPAVDGHSLVPLLTRAPGPRVWRTAALVEHHGPAVGPGDPDVGPGIANPPSYEAVRLTSARFRNAVYVEYVTGEREFYNLVRDPYERANTYAGLPAATQTQLHALLARLVRCHGARACWAASR